MASKKATPKKKQLNICVTGGLGFIGAHVVVKLINEGHKVAILDSKTDYGYLNQGELDAVMKERFFGIAGRMTDSVSLNIYTIDVGNPELKTLFEKETVLVTEEIVQLQMKNIEEYKDSKDKEYRDIYKSLEEEARKDIGKIKDLNNC